nr:hypothetical protein [Tanacetum cinerariifolium]
MATAIEQQVALDEALVPSAQRLRIRRSNFLLPSDIQSKESTLQVEYYACATGEATPKPKASARKKKSGSASSTTPPTPIATPTPTTIDVPAPRLYAAAKGKQPARATSHTDPSDVERTEAE